MLSRHQVRKVLARPLNGASNRLGFAMEEAGVTQEQLEALTGVSQATISKHLNGQRRSLPVDTADKLAQAFGMSIEDLFIERERVGA